MNKYTLQIDSNYNIVITKYTFDVQQDDIEITSDEYKKAQCHKKFNPETREFSEPIEVEEIEVLTEHELITKETHETTSLSAEDNLLNMDLITSLDDKLNLIMKHLGLV